jgi:hypothetical protein
MEGQLKRHCPDTTATTTFFKNVDLVVHLCTTYLSPVSFSALLRASPDAWRCVTQRRRGITMHSFVGMRVEQGLAAFFKSDHAARVLRQDLDSGQRDGLILTGGFLAAVLNGDPVDECRDVDIFVTKNMFASGDWRHQFDVPDLHVCRALYGAFESQWDIKYPGTHHVHKHKFTNIRCYGSIREILEQIVSFQLNGKTLQFLQSKNATITSYIGSFDLDVCKSYYGGGKFWTTRSSMDALRTRSCKLNVYDTYFDAYLSYQRDGPGGGPHFYCRQIYERLCKYLRRGYTIYAEDDVAFLADIMSTDDALPELYDWGTFWKDKICPVTKQIKLLDT